MNEDIFPDREQIPRLACHIPAVGEFQKTMIYSTWGYGLVTAAIERVTGKPFSVCVEQYIYQPLGMSRSTTNAPKVDNVVFKHWVGNYGVAHEFPWSLQRGWSDETGFGGAVGARSSIRELLIMYRSLLHAYNHQTNNKVDSTPGSPFKYACRLLYPHIGVGIASLEKQGYCLGTYRTQLPGNLSAASYNSILLQQKNSRQFGKTHAGRAIFHQIATFTGYNGLMLLDPLSQTAIVVLVNSLPLFDITDVLGRLLLGTILGEDDPTDYIGLANSVKDINMLLYDVYAAGLDKRKADVALSFPLKYYEGDYWNKDKIICYSVNVHGEDQIRVNVKGSSLTNYILHSWGGDLFCLPPDRERELSQSMWPFTSLKSRMFKFNCSKGRVLSFTWHHDITPGSAPETFTKNDQNSTAKL
ncbi:Beta-lactamase protein [Venustampulla echinocandica]|uniref:Beta-lactamase protein n=1 Tax=Venustampulla echinocandica TaxID=2656787 RepID=A0A370TU58_9HELO|nr:Beta-lactamase protein [Venustampulla echinocandica]RDL39061.1 Beta-lactamase protein [Venustampulla echinocandica]